MTNKLDSVSSKTLYTSDKGKQGIRVGGRAGWRAEGEVNKKKKGGESDSPKKTRTHKTQV